MALSIGIVGLPNVGKSTLFNALTKAQNAQAANYPFCTIEPNKATVPVPDRRIDALVDLVHPQKTINATVDFIDIAGLVRGASKGEGLGNQFLGNIRECAAILEVVRDFTAQYDSTTGSIYYKATIDGKEKKFENASDARKAYVDDQKKIASKAISEDFQKYVQTTFLVQWLLYFLVFF